MIDFEGIEKKYKQEIYGSIFPTSTNKRNEVK